MLEDCVKALIDSHSHFEHIDVPSQIRDERVIIGVEQPHALTQEWDLRERAEWAVALLEEAEGERNVEELEAPELSQLEELPRSFSNFEHFNALGEHLSPVSRGVYKLVPFVVESVISLLLKSLVEEDEQGHLPRDVRLHIQVEVDVETD